MGYFEHEGNIWEFITVSPSGTSEWHVECVELQNPNGFFGVAVVSTDGAEIRFEAGRNLPVPVLQHWLSLVPAPPQTTPED